MIDGSSTTPARERGVRARRQREAQRTHGIIAGIERQIPTYDLLGEEGLVRIEAAADTILQEIGIEFRGDEEALRLWREAGADVAGELVRFPMGLMRSILKTAPSTFVQHARNPERSLKIGGRNVVFAPAYGSPFVRDLEGGRRYGTLIDFENFVKLAYSIPWLHHSGGTVCEPVDIPVNKRHLDMVAAHLRLSDKPFMGSVTAQERAEDSIEMARIVFGREFVDGHCVIMGNINANSPLVYDATMTKALRAYAAANQCAVVVPFILGGAMGPVTTAGAIAQSLAETMAGCALTQLESPRRAGHLRQLSVVDCATLRLADLRHARAGARLARRRTARAPPRSPLALLGSVHLGENPRRAGDAGKHDVDARGGAVRSAFHPAFGGLARGRPRDGLREVHHGRGFLRCAACLDARPSA